MHATSMQAPITSETLFLKRSEDELQVKLKPTENNVKVAVAEVCKKIGLSESVAAVFQPAASAELNSQNYIVHFQSGQKLLLRRCCKFTGLERYKALYKMLRILREHDVRVPEFMAFDGKVYFEFEDAGGKACWVFFKYIEAEKYFSGTAAELADAAKQIGKMHACLKEAYQQECVTNVYTTETGKTGAHLLPRAGPSLTKSDWLRYLAKIETGNDEYDRLFRENRELIGGMIAYVEENYHLLQDGEVQNIHFDLNSLNYLVDKENNVTIMDFDTVRLGSVYTDIGFAFYRLTTTCVEQTQNVDLIPQFIHLFLESYKRGNPQIKLHLDKLVVATMDRALWNINTNLSLKYDQNSQDWLTGIPLNVKRLKQVAYLIPFLNPLKSI